MGEHPIFVPSVCCFHGWPHISWSILWRTLVQYRKIHEAPQKNHSWSTKIASGKHSDIENGPVEIVDLPMKNGGSFHSYGTVYQAGYGFPLQIFPMIFLFSEPRKAWRTTMPTGALAQSPWALWRAQREMWKSYGVLPWRGNDLIYPIIMITIWLFVI